MGYWTPGDFGLRGTLDSGGLRGGVGVVDSGAWVAALLKREYSGGGCSRLRLVSEALPASNGASQGFQNSQRGTRYEAFPRTLPRRVDKSRRCRACLSKRVFRRVWVATQPVRGSGRRERHAYTSYAEERAHLERPARELHVACTLAVLLQCSVVLSDEATEILESGDSDPLVGGRDARRNTGLRSGSRRGEW